MFFSSGAHFGSETPPDARGQLRARDTRVLPEKGLAQPHGLVVQLLLDDQVLHLLRGAPEGSRRTPAWRLVRLQHSVHLLSPWE